MVPQVVRDVGSWAGCKRLCKKNINRMLGAACSAMLHLFTNELPAGAILHSNVQNSKASRHISLTVLESASVATGWAGPQDRSAWLLHFWLMNPRLRPWPSWTIVRSSPAAKGTGAIPAPHHQQAARPARRKLILAVAALCCLCRYRQSSSA